MFPILSRDHAETVRGWSGTNPYGMVRLSLSEYVALMWAQVADEYHSAEHRDDYVAHVPLNDGDVAFVDLCEAVDASYITTPDHPYPFGTWNYGDPADLTGPAHRGPRTMLVYVDDRGWPTYEVLTATEARDRFDGLAADFYGDGDD